MGIPLVSAIALLGMYPTDILYQGEITLIPDYSLYHVKNDIKGLETT